MSFFSRLATGSQGAAHSALEIPSYGQALPRMMLELERARRFEHPLCVVVVGPHMPPVRLTYAMMGSFLPWSAEPFPQSPAEQLPTLLVHLGSFLRTQLRTIDVLATTADAQSYLLGLVETGRPGAELLLDRFRRGFRDYARASLQAGIAEFPHEGMTLEDLLEHAERERVEPPEGASPPVRKRTSHG